MHALAGEALGAKRREILDDDRRAARHLLERVRQHHLLPGL
jgi:hypothetical protein